MKRVGGGRGGRMKFLRGLLCRGSSTRDLDRIKVGLLNWRFEKKKKRKRERALGLVGLESFFFPPPVVKVMAKTCDRGATLRGRR